MVRAANESFARKMNIITIMTRFCKFIPRQCDARYGFNCTLMYLSSPIYGIFGHWLSEVNTLEIKKFDTQ